MAMTGPNMVVISTMRSLLFSDLRAQDSIIALAASGDNPGPIPGVRARAKFEVTALAARRGPAM
jgi:hypothetical protein